MGTEGRDGWNCREGAGVVLQGGGLMLMLTEVMQQSFIANTVRCSMFMSVSSNTVI